MLSYSIKVVLFNVNSFVLGDLRLYDGMRHAIASRRSKVKPVLLPDLVRVI